MRPLSAQRITRPRNPAAAPTARRAGARTRRAARLVDRRCARTRRRRARRRASPALTPLAVPAGPVGAHVEVRTVADRRAERSDRVRRSSGRRESAPTPRATAGSRRSSRAPSSQRRPPRLRVRRIAARAAQRAPRRERQRAPPASVPPPTSDSSIGRCWRSSVSPSVVAPSPPGRPAERRRDGAPARARRVERRASSRRCAGRAARRSPAPSSPPATRPPAARRSRPCRARARRPRRRPRARVRRGAAVADRPHERVGLALVAGDEDLARAEHPLSRRGAHSLDAPIVRPFSAPSRSPPSPTSTPARGAARDRQPDGAVGHQLAQHVAVVVDADEQEVDGDVARVARRRDRARLRARIGARPTADDAQRVAELTGDGVDDPRRADRRDASAAPSTIASTATSAT